MNPEAISPSANFRAALVYAASGYRVFPLAAGSKTPLPGSRGHLDATTDTDALGAIWAEGCNVGVACGPKSGFWALDVDPKNDGLTSYEQLRATTGWVDGPSYRTPSGGLHIWFRYPEGAEVRNSASVVAPGIDVRGSGGYVVVPPSQTEAGQYRWEAPRRPPRQQELPHGAPFLLEAITKPPRGQGSVCDDQTGPIQSGGRNNYLASFAGRLRRAGCSLSEVRAALAVVNRSRCTPPLDEREVRRIARSISRYPVGVDRSEEQCSETDLPRDWWRGRG